MEFRSDVSVSLVQNVGDDRSIVAAARVSTRGVESLEDLDTDASSGLINYLMKNRHGTPFEHASMTFFVHAPIFVFREFHRHRIGWSYNEESARYKQLEPIFYLPDRRGGEMQRPGGKPGHYDYVDATPQQEKVIREELEHVYSHAYKAYDWLVKQGVAKEVARMCLPVSIYSSMYATCNPRSLMAFLSLRTKREDAMFPSKPMKEINMVADMMEASFADLFPITWRAYNESGRVAP